MSGGVHQDPGVDGPAYPRQVHEPPGPPTLLRMGPPQLLVSIFSGSLTKDHSLICVFYLSNIGAYMNLLILQVFIELHTGQDSFYFRITGSSQIHDQRNHTELARNKGIFLTNKVKKI